MNDTRLDKDEADELQVISSRTQGLSPIVTSKRSFKIRRSSSDSFLIKEASAANYLFPGGSVRQAVSEPSLDRNSAEQNSEIIAGVGRRVENADSIRVDEGWLEEVTAREPSFASTDRFESFVDSGYRGSSEIMEN